MMNINEILNYVSSYKFYELFKFWNKKKSIYTNVEKWGYSCKIQPTFDVNPKFSDGLYDYIPDILTGSFFMYQDLTDWAIVARLQVVQDTGFANWKTQDKMIHNWE